MKLDRVLVKPRQVHVQRAGEVREVPVLHHDHQVHHEDEGGEEGPRELGGGEKVAVEPVPGDPVGGDDGDDDRGGEDADEPEDDDAGRVVGLVILPAKV